MASGSIVGRPCPGDPDYGAAPTPMRPADVWLTVAGMSGWGYAALRASGASATELDAARGDALTAVKRALAADFGYLGRLQDMWDPERA